MSTNIGSIHVELTASTKNFENNIKRSFSSMKREASKSASSMAKSFNNTFRAKVNPKIDKSKLKKALTLPDTSANFRAMGKKNGDAYNKALSASLRSGSAKVQAQVKTSIAQVSKQGEALKKVGDNLSSKGLRGSVGFSLPAALVLKSAVGDASDFETSLIGVKKNIADLGKAGNEAKLAEFTKHLRDAGRDSRLGASGLAVLSTEAGKIGDSAKEALKFASLAEKISVGFDFGASLEAVTATGDTVAKVRSLLRESNDDFEKTANAINFFADTTASKPQKIISVFQRSAGVMRESTNLTSDSMAALAASIDEVSPNSFQAGTALKNLVSRLAAGKGASDTAKAGFKALGIDAEDMAKMISTDAEGAIVSFLEKVKELPKHTRAGVVGNIVTLENANSVLGLAGRIDLLTQRFADARTGMSQTRTVANEFNLQMDTFAAKADLFGSKIRDLKISIGNILMPVLIQLFDRLTPVIKKLSDFIQLNPEKAKWGLAFTAIAIAIPPVLLGLGLMLSALGSIKVGMAILGASALKLGKPFSAVGAKATMLKTSLLGAFKTPKGLPKFGVALKSFSKGPLLKTAIGMTLLASRGRGVGKSLAMSGKGLGKLSKLLNPFKAGLGKVGTLVGGLAGRFKPLQKIVGTVGGAFAGKILPVFSKLIPLSKTYGSVLAKVAAPLAKLGVFGKIFGKTLGFLVGGPIGAAISAFFLFKDEILGFVTSTGAAIKGWVSENAGTIGALKQSFASLGAIIGFAFTSAKNSLGAFFTSIGMAFGDESKGKALSWGEVVRSVLSFLAKGVSVAVSSLTILATWLSENIGPAINAFSAKVVSGIGIVKKSFSDWKESNQPLIESISSSWILLKESATLLWGALKKAFSDIGGAIASAFGEESKGQAISWGDLLSSVFSAVGVVINGAIKVITFLADVLTNAVSVGVAAATAAIGSFLGGVKAVFSSIAEVISGQKTVWEGLGGIIAGAKDIILAPVVGIIAGVKELFDPAKFAEIGTWVIEGLKNGITAGKDKVLGAMRAVSEGVKAIANSVFKTASPSKAFKEIGGWVSQGLALGIEKDGDKAMKSAKYMAQGVIESTTGVLQVNSPSKVMKSIGMWVARGLGLGIESEGLATAKTAKGVGNDVGEAIKDGLENSLERDWLKNQFDKAGLKDLANRYGLEDSGTSNDLSNRILGNQGALDSVRQESGIAPGASAAIQNSGLQAGGVGGEGGLGGLGGFGIGSSNSELESFNTNLTLSQDLIGSLKGASQTAFEDIGGALLGLTDGTVSWQESLQQVGKTILGTLVSSLAEFAASWIANQLSMFIVEKTLGAKSAATSTALAATTAAAVTASWTPAAIAASIATLGGASAAGTAAFIGSLAVGTAASLAFGAINTVGQGAIQGLGSSNSTNDGSSNFGGAFADGGRPPLNKTSLVGEEGPELFVPDTAGTIVPNDELSGGGAGSKGMTDVNITVLNYGSGDTATVNQTSDRDFEVVITQAKNAVAADIRQGQGVVSGAIEGTYGTRRRGS